MTSVISKKEASLSFDGMQEPSQFLKQWQNWIVANGYTTKPTPQKLALFRSCLSGSALDWYEEKHDSFGSIADAENALQTRFYTQNMVNSELSIITDPTFVQERTESVEEFTSRFRDAQRRTSRARAHMNLPALTEAELGMSYRSKLTPALQAKLLEANIPITTSVVDLEAKAQLYERANLLSQQGERYIASLRVAQDVHQRDHNGSHTSHSVNPDRLMQIERAHDRERMIRIEQEQEKLRQNMQDSSADADRKLLSNQINRITDTLNAVMNNTTSVMNNTTSTPQQGTYRNQRRDIQTGECYNCGRAGHYSSQCDKPRKSNQARGETCSACGRHGHMARDCRNPSGPRTQHSRYGGHQTGQPYPTQCQVCLRQGSCERWTCTNLCQRCGANKAACDGRTCVNRREQCSGCGKPGHRAIVCRNRNRNNTRPGTAPTAATPTIAQFNELMQMNQALTQQIRLQPGPQPTATTAPHTTAQFEQLVQMHKALMDTLQPLN